MDKNFLLFFLVEIYSCVFKISPHNLSKLIFVPKIINNGGGWTNMPLVMSLNLMSCAEIDILLSQLYNFAVHGEYCVVRYQLSDREPATLPQQGAGWSVPAGPTTTLAARFWETCSAVISLVLKLEIG